MKNPFKFGSIVEEPYFMNRVDEIKKVKSILNSANHMIIISPRRYGKTSLINKAAKTLRRPYIILDLQLITTQSDFAAQLLKHHDYFISKYDEVSRMLNSMINTPENFVIKYYLLFLLSTLYYILSTESGIKYPESSS